MVVRFGPAIRLLVALLLLTLLNAPTASATDDKELENLVAFSRLYGYLRFFHPSDAAADLDWINFAVLGAERIGAMDDDSDLQTVLLDLVLPFAPTVQIFPSENPPPPVVSAETSGELVAWQHEGVDLGNENGAYRSLRTGRDDQNFGSGSPSGFGTVTQCLPAPDLRGRKIRLSGLARTEVTGTGNSGRLWLRVDRPDQVRGFFDNMGLRPITSPDWQRYEIKGDVTGDATMVCFGCILTGQGQAWFDDVRLEVLTDEDRWEEIPLNNPGFESVSGESPTGWSKSPGYQITAVTDDAQEGEFCVSVATRTDHQLFSRTPAVGETIFETIGGGLTCRVPLALTDADARRTGPGLAELTAQLKKLSRTTADIEDEALRLGNVVIAWNIFQHFYPYFDVVDVDWKAELPGFLSEARAATDDRAYLNTLRRLVAKLGDGHGNVSSRLMMNESPFEFLVEQIENQVAVVWAPDHCEAQVGDVVVSVDGKNSAEMLAQDMELASGSQQWRSHKAALRFGYGPAGSKAEMVLRRGDQELQITATRYREVWKRPDNQWDLIQEIEPEIWYVNLDRAGMDTISTVMDKLAVARGVIFDLRGYPNSNHRVIQHLMTMPDTSASWMQIPRIIYPDRKDVQWSPLGWGLVPQEPYIAGTVVFLTDGRAISYAESFLGFVENYHLGEIVGGPTAGANGNVNPFTLPGDFSFSWTGMRVVKHDGRQQHLVGVTPTVPLEPTLDALREGRDEYVEKALEIIRGR